MLRGSVDLGIWGLGFAVHFRGSKPSVFVKMVEVTIELDENENDSDSLKV